MKFLDIKNNLNNLGYKVSIFENIEDANLYLDSQLDNVTIGIGGSETVNAMGLYEKLITHNKIYWHQKPTDELNSMEIRKLSKDAEIYLSSVNGIAETGEIVNIDNNCDRVSNILFGHKKVYLIIGKNKIEKNLNDAIFRARNIAAPLNAKRLNKKTPCAINADKCYDCNSPDRICRSLSILWNKPAGCEYEIVLINDNLGF